MPHRSRRPADRVVRRQRTALAALVALTVPALAACGAGSGAGSSHPARPVADRSTLLRPATLVLQAGDVGASYLVVPAATERGTLRKELEHESARARTADRKAWIGGYTATYVRGGATGVISEAMTYRNAAAARIVSTDRTGLAYGIRSLHGRRLRTPRSAPGTPRFMLAGTVNGVRLYMYGWQRGSVLEDVGVFGRHISVARLMRLARRQDLRLTHPTFGA